MNIIGRQIGYKTEDDEDKDDDDDAISLPPVFRMTNSFW